MNRRLLLLPFLFTLGVSAVASAQPPASPARESSPPAWLPRTAFVGTYFRRGVIAPEARVQWQVPFYRGHADSLSLLFEPMAALAVAFPDPNLPTGPNDEVVPLSSLQLYGLMLGVGYHSRRESGVDWGFQIGTGPAWYSARFSAGEKDRESFLVGLVDGRAHLGYHFGPLALGVAVGYSDPYNYRRSSLARGHVGGPQVGLYADWR